MALASSPPRALRLPPPLAAPDARRSQRWSRRRVDEPGGVLRRDVDLVAVARFPLCLFYISALGAAPWPASTSTRLGVGVSYGP
jgi:hypothetical protein